MVHLKVYTQARIFTSIELLHQDAQTVFFTWGIQASLRGRG